MHQPMSVSFPPLRVNCKLDKTERLRKENDSAAISFEGAGARGPQPLAPVCHPERRQRGFLLEVDHVDGIPGYMLVRDALTVAICFGRELVIAFRQIMVLSGKGVNRLISNARLCHLTVRRWRPDVHL